MASTNPLHAGPSTSSAALIARQVADDMTTIFGSSDVREVAHPATTASSRVGWRRAIALALTGIAVLAVVTLGIAAGRTAIGATPAGDDARPVRHLVSPPVRSAVVSLPSMVAPARGAIASPQVGHTVAVAPEPERMPASAPRPALATPMTTLPLAVADRLPGAPSGGSVAAPSQPRSVADAHPVETVSPLDCDLDSNDCITVRLDAADRRVARAFDHAEAAGVRPRDLRGYNGEWNRARREADDRPLDALHVYGMIESDLYTLADRASGRDGGTER